MRYRFSTFVSIAVCLSAIPPQPGVGQSKPVNAAASLQASVQKSISKLDRSLVAVVAVGKAGPMVVGTGLLVSNEGVFATALHVLRQGRGIDIKALIRVNEQEQKIVDVEVLSTDDARDLALCRAVIPAGIAKSVLLPVKLAASSDVPPGTFVVVSGFPLAANKASSHFGIVSSRTAIDESLEVAAFVNEGESGAPVVRVDDGEVIGMVSSVRTASTYVGAARGVEDQNSGLTLAARSEWVSALMARTAAQEKQLH